MAGPKAFGERRFGFSTPSPEPGPGMGPTYDPFGAIYNHQIGVSIDVNDPNSSQVGTMSGGLDGVDIDQWADDPSRRMVAAASVIYGVSPAGLLDRLRSTGSDIDADIVQALGVLATMAKGQYFNGTDWDRARSASAAVLAGFTSLGAGLTSAPGNWSINHVPAAATQATISRAAGGAGVRHVCTSIAGVLIIPPAVNQPAIQLNLRDGATGAGTILWSQQFGIGAALAAGGQQQVNFSGLKIVGSANVAMTLEFSAAGAATTLQSVALTGHEAA